MIGHFQICTLFPSSILTQGKDQGKRTVLVLRCVGFEAAKTASSKVVRGVPSHEKRE
jgi:hypothetical protein